jgi:hypothetical protein
MSHCVCDEGIGFGIDLPKDDSQHKAAGFGQYHTLVLWIVMLFGYPILEKAEEAIIAAIPFLNRPGVHVGDTTFLDGLITTHPKISGVPQRPKSSGRNERNH